MLVNYGGSFSTPGYSKLDRTVQALLASLPTDVEIPFHRS